MSNAQDLHRHHIWDLLAWTLSEDVFVLKLTAVGASRSTSIRSQIPNADIAVSSRPQTYLKLVLVSISANILAGIEA